MIKHFSLSLFAVLMMLPALAQERKDLTVSLAGGKLASPYYANNTAGRFYSIGFDYALSGRHTLAVNYTAGDHHYFDGAHTSDPGFTIRTDGTNAEAAYHTFSVLYKYSFIKSSHLTGTVGAGAGMMTHSRRYPFSTSNSFYYQESAWTDLVFPVKLEMDYRLSANLKAGVTGGFFIQPDFPVLAYHLGPRLSYVIK